MEAGCANILVQALKRLRSSWNMNAAAQAAGLAAQRDPGWLESGVRKLREAADALWKGLRLAGPPPVPSRTYYALLRVGVGKIFRRRLMDTHVLVRDCASFGLPDRGGQRVPAGRGLVGAGGKGDGKSRRTVRSPCRVHLTIELE